MGLPVDNGATASRGEASLSISSVDSDGNERISIQHRKGNGCCHEVSGKPKHRASCHLLLRAHRAGMKQCDR
jgi:hypothetical protein